jgi:hypothetical protein
MTPDDAAAEKEFLQAHRPVRASVHRLISWLFQTPHGPYLGADRKSRTDGIIDASVSGSRWNADNCAAAARSEPRASLASVFCKSQARAYNEIRVGEQRNYRRRDELNPNHACRRSVICSRAWPALMRAKLGSAPEAL